MVRSFAHVRVEERVVEDKRGNRENVVSEVFRVGDIAEGFDVLDLIWL